MDKEYIKQVGNYLSSLEGGVIIQYSFEGDRNKPKYLFLYKTENGRVHGLLLGPFGQRVEPLEYIAKEDFKIAIFKSIDDTLKDNQ